MYQTQADKVANANSWTNAQACGYLDGVRDKSRGIPPAIPQLEMTDYAHGYFKGYASTGEAR